MRSNGEDVDGSQRRVDRLTWLEAVTHEDHGAPHAGIRLALVVLALSMNGAGDMNPKFAPSQVKIGKRCLAGERTVRRHLEAAIRLGWLQRVEAHRDRGRNWKRYAYRATVPANFPESELLQTHARGAAKLAGAYQEDRPNGAGGPAKSCNEDRPNWPTIPPRSSLIRNPSGADAPAPEARAPQDLETDPPPRSSAERIMARIRARAAGGAA